MRPFNEDETISVPTGECPIRAARTRDPVIALRIHGALNKQLPLPRKDRITVGSSPACDLVIEDRCVSRFHCTIERRGRDLVLTDQRSRNGTFVNGNKVQVAEVRAGAIITLGRIRVVAVGRRSRDTLTAFEMLQGTAPAFRRALDLALRAASTKCSVLILGETGTGKELFARAIHDASPRSAGPFVPVNCGAIPGNLIGSELFGHKKGAFTGAVDDRRGVFAEADGGSLFLDELGELPRPLQPNLLRVLETGFVRPVGDALERAVDVRLIAATNRIEAPTSRDAALRLDLYHRVATVEVSLPPLRERKEDIPVLVRAFLDELAPLHGRREVPPRVMRGLRHYRWPGNIRELKHAVTRAVTLCPRELTLEGFLPRKELVVPQVALASPVHRTMRAGDRLDPTSELRREQMEAALQEYGSMRRAAAALGVPKSTFADRARRFGLKTGRR